jgi:DNA invertase Pin-like site-specific DNA recombinase
MSKLSAEHLSRGAYVYVRQSTPDQLRHNHESRRRQYALAERARALGFADVVVIDDDLGITASGIERPGFERLLAAICRGSVGAVVSIEASRLARNGRDWHTLLEFCAVVGSLIVDESGVYDPRSPDDRFMLGMKGTFSEMELSMFRQRSVEALKLKAARGDLHTTVAIGYVRGPDDRIELDPDLRIQQAIGLVFAKFAELHSARQVLLWLRQEAIALPSAQYGPQGRSVLWKLPVYGTVLRILTNPVYAGTYTFGRTESQVCIEDGRKRVRRGIPRARERWQVLIGEHHEGYISWDTYEHNQRVIADNANMKGEMVRGMLRRGEALLAGLLRCGHCGRKLHVAYSGEGGNTSRYHCRGASINHGAGNCIAFGSLRVDQAISAELLRLLKPLGIEAALTAIDQNEAGHDAKRQHIELALEQARFEATRAHRQYDAADPDNRLVTAELERRWNERLAAVARHEQELAALGSQCATSLSEEQRSQLLALGSDLDRAWNHPAANPETRKRILRAVLKEIVVHLGEAQIELKLHWQGGDHTELCVPRNRSGMHRWKTDAGIEELIGALARLMSDGAIAALLNRSGKRTAKGHTWTEARVRSFRGDRHIAVYREGERSERGELTLDETAKALNISKMTALRMISCGVLPAKQLCKGAPWVICRSDLETPAIRHAAEAGVRGPLPGSTDQISLDFQ